MQITGRGGIELRERWATIRAPTSASRCRLPEPVLPLRSRQSTSRTGIIFHSECQVRYVAGCLAALRHRRAAAMDVKHHARRVLTSASTRHRQLVLPPGDDELVQERCRKVTDAVAPRRPTGAGRSRRRWAADQSQSRSTADEPLPAQQRGEMRPPARQATDHPRKTDDIPAARVALAVRIAPRERQRRGAVACRARPNNDGVRTSSPPARRSPIGVRIQSNACSRLSKSSPSRTGDGDVCSVRRQFTSVAAARFSRCRPSAQFRCARAAPSGTRIMICSATYLSAAPALVRSGSRIPELARRALQRARMPASSGPVTTRSRRRGSSRFVIGDVGSPRRRIGLRHVRFRRQKSALDRLDESVPPAVGWRRPHHPAIPNDMSRLGIRDERPPGRGPPSSRRAGRRIRVPGLGDMDGPRTFGIGVRPGDELHRGTGIRMRRRRPGVSARPIAR